MTLLEDYDLGKVLDSEFLIDAFVDYAVHKDAVVEWAA